MSTYKWLLPVKKNVVIDIPIGWTRLISSFMLMIDELAQRTPMTFQILGIKELYGQLYIAYSLADASEIQEYYIEKHLNETRQISLNTCVTCGLGGEIRIFPNIQRVYCDEHFKNEVKKMQETQ